MEMQRKPFSRSAQGRNGANGQIVTIGMPVPYEGVGKALRASFSASNNSTLPDDMLALLAKLDQR